MSRREGLARVVGFLVALLFFKASCNNSNRCSASFPDNLFPAAQHAYLLQTDWQDEPES